MSSEGLQSNGETNEIGETNKIDETEKKYNISCLLQAIGFLVHGALMLKAYPDFHDIFRSVFFPDVIRDGVYEAVAGCVILVISSVFVIVLVMFVIKNGNFIYSQYFRYLITVLFIIAGCLYIAGSNYIVVKFWTKIGCDSHCKSLVLSEAVLLFFLCFAIGLQVGFDYFKPKNRRIILYPFSYIPFSIMLMVYIYQFGSDALGDSGKAAESGATILLIASVLTIVTFSVFIVSPNTISSQSNLLVRIVLAVCILTSGCLIFGGFTDAFTSSSSSDGLNIYNDRYGILPFIQAIIFAVDLVL